MICGAPKHLKTMWLISLLCSTAVGRPWFDRQVQQSKVLYVIGEGGDAFIGRVKAWQKHNNVESFGGNLRILKRMPNLVDEKGEGLDALKREFDVQKFPPEVLALDTLNRTMPGADEDTRTLSLFFDRLAMLQECLPGLTIAIPHHTKKGATVFRGGQVIAGNADGMIYIERPDMQKLQAEVTCDWFRNAANFDPFSFTCAMVPVLTDAGVAQDFVVVDGIGQAEGKTRESKPTRKATEDAKVEAFNIISARGELHYNEWKRLTKEARGGKLGNDTFQSAVDFFVDKGAVVKIGDGQGAVYRFHKYSKPKPETQAGPETRP
jgi:hypothetical protein